ncbi:CBASS cGAMP synthase [Phocoenobacter skyensis]|uniref:Cyclic GMP-AMP synthase n=1 Tax=Phocoenobacter skyensis TaxID=97481 RepID=A0AAJ6NEA2_9PAST|nr:CBASS cGAMP synthase [Pasteurella skyensis]MDP8175231.1 CBASS cGAMP synthase [Pasteurella skyensis]
MNNIHSVFTSRKEGFKYKILPSQNDFNVLNEAKKSVRSYLKTHIKEYLESHQIPHISPKFRVQGSWAYGTCNAPAKLGQEMDVDYGVYLPVRAFDGFDVDTQSEQARTYFEAIESMLEELCKENGWKLDTSKSSCIRLKIQDNAHMDIPLYAVPDSMFDSFQEKNEIALTTESARFDSIHESKDWFVLDEDFIAFSEESLQDMDIQTIHMARRDGSWQSSDCEIIRQWFSTRLEKEPNGGQQLRSICRYLKAWRDWVFDENGAPSSILLMIIACQYYEYKQGRDDLALLNILENLSQSLNNNVYENIKEHENEDFNRMSPNEREIAKIYADNLYKNFIYCLKNSNKDSILTSLTKQWGERIPRTHDLIEINIEPFCGQSLIQDTITPQVPLRQG